MNHNVTESWSCHLCGYVTYAKPLGDKCPACNDGKSVSYKKGGDAPCHQEPETRPLPTRGSNAAPNVQPAGCGTVGWLKQELSRWPDDTVVYVDFDREGGNEYPADAVRKFNEMGMVGIKIS